MVVRKHKNPTPSFRMPPPYQPITGDRATLHTPGIFPYCAMVQVAKEDTHDNYVICRGFDVRINKFIDYEEGNSDKPGIPVAKPFGKRGTGKYQIAQIFGAVLPLQSTNPSPSDVPWRVGQNPGVCAESTGQPADLDEVVDELYTDEGKLVNWMLIDSAGGGVDYVEITYIDDATRGFYMKDQGVCIGNLLTWNPEADWKQKYPGSTDPYIVESTSTEVFIGFVSQSRAGVVGQRYPCNTDFGSKTCAGLTLPFVLVDGGGMVVASLDQNHPGCGEVFDVNVNPDWDPSNNEWTLGCNTAYKAIDLRKGAPTPDEFATGLFIPRVSFTYGVILEVIDLDCVSPDECDFCGEAL